MRRCIAKPRYPSDIVKDYVAWLQEHPNANAWVYETRKLSVSQTRAAQRSKAGKCTSELVSLSNTIPQEIKRV